MLVVVRADQRNPVRTRHAAQGDVTSTPSDGDVRPPLPVSGRRASIVCPRPAALEGRTALGHHARAVEPGIGLFQTRHKHQRLRLRD
jgi:hypothetical protein